MYVGQVMLSVIAKEHQHQNSVKHADRWHERILLARYGLESADGVVVYKGDAALQDLTQYCSLSEIKPN